MKRIFLFSAPFFAALSGVTAQEPGEAGLATEQVQLEDGAEAETTTDEASSDDEFPARRTPAVESDENALKNVSEADRRRLFELLNDAARFVSGIRLQEALQALEEADGILKKAEAPDLFQIHNLRGAVFTKMRDFEKAQNSFETAIKLRPDVFHPRFNLAEVKYVTGRYKEAEAAFDALGKDYPELDEGTRSLLKYKVMISQLKQDREADALKILGAFSYLDDTPVYYLGNAAVAFQKNEKEEAQSWIESARKIYSAQQLEVFLDALIEAGWIETL